MNLLNNITTFKGERSRAVSPENPTGEKGRACMEDLSLIHISEPTRRS